MSRTADTTEPPTLLRPEDPGTGQQEPPATVLTIEGLDVSLGTGDRAVRAVRGVSLTVGRGEAVGLVGESGSGKSLTCRSALGLLPEGIHISAGRIGLAASATAPAAELTALKRAEWNTVRGTRVAAVFRDPASYLNPSVRVGRQLAEQLRVGRGTPRAVARARSVELLGAVGLHRPDEVYDRYPHELSGGMLQRVLIAIAVSCEPELLIADEATTALDVVIQAEILELLHSLRTTHGLALVLVTHDLAVVAERCDRVVVMYAGEVVEDGPTAEVLAAPAHPYTEALLRVASLGAWDRRELEVIEGQPPETGAEPTGCRFAPRCPYAEPRCTRGPVELRTRADGRRARCVRADVPPVTSLPASGVPATEGAPT